LGQSPISVDKDVRAFYHGKFTHSDSCTGARIDFERTQAKGSFKAKADKVAERLDADIILPASSVKPEYKGKPTLLKWLTGSARTFRGPVVLGIRDVSRTFALQYGKCLFS
jgi:hypothetical protein